MTSRFACAVALATVSVAGCTRAPEYRTFATPEAAVAAVIAAVKANDTPGLVAIFGPDSADLVSTDGTTDRRNREVFTVATAEQWRLVDRGPDTRELVIGYEEWPFPIPLVREAGGWRFDTAAGKEEVIARRIGRNELGAIQVCRRYVAAQQAYAARGHDGRPAGTYAARLRSDPGTQNGLYWPATRGEPRSPLGDLVAQASADAAIGSTNAQGRAPFHGYYFRLLESPSATVPGALLAWPAEYDVTGIMTFVVGPDGVVREKDLGPETATAVEAIRRHDATGGWPPVTP